MPFAETILQLKTYRVNFNREGVKPYTEAESEPMKLINPSIYWKYLGGELFLLKQLAQIVFSVLSSSSICETKFRDYEYIMDKRRLRLRPELAEKLVFVYRYCNKMMKL